MQTMKQNNINNNQNDKAMKQVLNILFKGKHKQEEKPKVKITVLKEFTPEERERYNKWCQELNVGAMYDDKKLRLG